MSHSRQIETPAHFEIPAKVDRPAEVQHQFDYENQNDAYMELLMACVNSIQGELGMQSTNALAAADMANGAAMSVSAMDIQLSNCAADLASLTGTDHSQDGSFSQALSEYQALQTWVSNMQQNLGNINQGASTELSNLTDAQKQLVGFAQVANDNKDSTNNNIATWGS